jgi:hypothetical protein
VCLLTTSINTPTCLIKLSAVRGSSGDEGEKTDDGCPSACLARLKEWTTARRAAAASLGVGEPTMSEMVAIPERWLRDVGEIEPCSS